MPRKLNPAEVVIGELGVRPLARELAIDPTTVLRWKGKGLVPAEYHLRVLEIARNWRRRLTVNDLVHGRDAA